MPVGWREAIVAGLSIPLSFVMAFIGLYASGNTINFISLFSLILAIGILVDILNFPKTKKFVKVTP